MNHITMQLYIYLDNPDMQSGQLGLRPSSPEFM
jgi:hypothetical protein